MIKDKLYYVNGGDSMGHIVKGNIGMFISCGKNIKGSGISVTNISNNGTDLGVSPLIKNNMQKMQGATCNGILFTGSEDINLKCEVSNIQSDSGKDYSFKLYNISSDNITVNKENLTKNQ